MPNRSITSTPPIAGHCRYPLRVLYISDVTFQGKIFAYHSNWPPTALASTAGGHSLFISFLQTESVRSNRCTCTVGRSRYSLFDFSYENLTNYRPVAVTCNSYAECKDCKIGGFCGGGCQLSHQIDFKKCCTYEEEVFSHFMKTLFIPYIKSKYNEVNQNERKAENRCT